MEKNGGALPAEYLDVVIASIKETGPFGFSVQVLSSDSE